MTTKDIAINTKIIINSTNLSSECDILVININGFGKDQSHMTKIKVRLDHAKRNADLSVYKWINNNKKSVTVHNQENADKKNKRQQEILEYKNIHQTIILPFLLNHLTDIQLLPEGLSIPLLDIDKTEGYCIREIIFDMRCKDLMTRNECVNITTNLACKTIEDFLRQTSIPKALIR